MMNEIGSQRRSTRQQQPPVSEVVIPGSTSAVKSPPNLRDPAESSNSRPDRDDSALASSIHAPWDVPTYYGTSFQLKQCLRELSKQMDSFPGQETSAYRHAQQAAPLLVESSEQVRFLRCDNFVVARAAARLASHWRQRRRLFGPRAFCGMNMTGQGALNEQDIETLQQGFVCRLPSRCQQQRVTLLDDGTNDAAAMTDEMRQSRERCRFYMLAAAAETADELTVIRLVSPGWSPDMTAYQDLVEAVPVRLHCLHYCLVSADPAERADFPALVEQQLPRSRRGMVQMHVAASTDELAQQLASVLDSSLPLQFGASWVREAFENWRPHQSRKEEQQQVQFELEQKLLPTRRQIRARERYEYRAECRRRRRKERRQREQKTFDVLQSRFLSLSATKLRLITEGQYLTNILTDARRLMMACEHAHRQWTMATAAPCIVAWPAAPPLRPPPVLLLLPAPPVNRRSEDIVREALTQVIQALTTPLLPSRSNP